MWYLFLACQPTDFSEIEDEETADEPVAEPVAEPLSLIDPLLLPQAENPCREAVFAQVNYVVDGDTLYVQTPTGEEKIRIIGINTPEIAYEDDPADCFGDEAHDRARTLLNDQYIWLTFDAECMDVYDRTLAYVHLGLEEEDFFERRILREGFAWAFPFDTTPTFIDVFASDEAQAVSNVAGGWEACGW